MRQDHIVNYAVDLLAGLITDQEIDTVHLLLIDDLVDRVENTFFIETEHVNV